MRISLVSEHASPLAVLGGVDAGGQNVHVAALAAALADRGHEVSVYTRRDDPSLPTRVRMGPGVSVVHIDAGPPVPVPKERLLPWMGEFGDALAAEWAVCGPDVVHSHFWMSGVAAQHAGAQLGPDRPALVHTFHALGHVRRRHQGADDDSPPERTALEPRVGLLADSVLATCSDEVAELVSVGVPAEQIRVVPCGVDDELFTPVGPADPVGRRHRIVSVGRLVPRKGVDLVISALAELARRGRDDVELVIAGGSQGPEAITEDAEVRRLAAHARTEGVADAVVFRGRVAHDELPALLRSADAVVCAPWYEPFGIVPLEAMATGTPVVAAAVGGLIDSVAHGVTGLHVPPRNPLAIASALEQLLDAPALRAAFGRAGRARVLRRYTWARVAAATEQCYRAVLHDRGVLREHTAAPIETVGVNG